MGKTRAGDKKKRIIKEEIRKEDGISRKKDVSEKKGKEKKINSNNDKNQELSCELTVKDRKGDGKRL